MDTSKKQVRRFRGFNNVADTTSLSSEWAVQADNVDVTSTSGLKRCTGYVRRTTNTSLTGAYATMDQTRLYIVDAGELRQVNNDLTYKVLKTGLTSAPVYFEEVNGVVYYSNGVDIGCITPAGWMNWGVAVPDRSPLLSFVTGDLPFGKYSAVTTFVDANGIESGNSKNVALIEGSGQLDLSDIPSRAGHTTNVYVTTCNGTVFYLLGENVGSAYSFNDENVLGRELPYWNADAPRGRILAFFQGQIWGSEAFPQYDYTVIWGSLPLQFHHFRYDIDGLMVPGVVRMLETAGESLIIGTDRQVWSYDGEKLQEEANYGVVDGFHPARLEDKLFFWTLRGMCSALPFKNMTEDKFYVAPGTSAGAAMFEKDGSRRYVVALRQGGQPYNRR